jgi:hypothetical protein
MSDKCMAIACENGEVWIECCNGSSGCPCEGKVVFFDRCVACGGTGIEPEGQPTAHRGNLRAITNAVRLGGGYIGNPHGRLR